MSAIILLIVLLATGYTKASATCGRKLDILLSVDGSTTVCNGTQTCPQWTSIIEFCKNIVKSFKIGRDDTKIAFLLMTDKLHVQWNLDEGTNETTLLSAIDKVAYTGGRFTLINLPSALSLLTKVFNPSYGDRSDAPNLIISITDGVPDIPALLGSILSTAYQLLGIAAFEVCVRPGCSEDFIRGIAAFPHKAGQTFFLVDGFFSLDPIRDDVVNNICPYQMPQPLLGLPGLLSVL
jgi:hypothetical protein